MSDDTKEKIIAGAYRALVRSGYHATSVKDIAAEAGVAQGLVHYYFESKEDLLVAAIEYGCEIEDSIAPLLELPPIEAARWGFEWEKEQLRKRSELYVLVFDMFGVGLHNERIAAAVRQYTGSRREVIAGIGRALAEQGAAPHGTRSDALASVIWGSFVGIALQKFTDPAFDADGALDALADMVFSYVGLASPITTSQQGAV